ncbi:MAG: gamma-glutamyltransferase [Gammaproteobacteria bacterium]|nr:gamma-glutamyltransferase [Gammaproteobacteria bacterium]
MHGLNASGRSPAAWTPDHFARYESMPSLGWDAVTVPGAVSAWVALSEQFGKLPFERLFESGIHYAENGFPVGPKSAYFFALAKQRFAGYEAFNTNLPAGRASTRTGDTLRLPDRRPHACPHCRDARRSVLSRRELAEAIAADAAAAGGAMTVDDLASHSADWVQPISQAFQHARLHEIPPSGQGLMALIALGIVEQLGPGNAPLDSADSVHCQIEAFRIAWAEAERHIADIDHMTIAPESLLDPDYLARRAAEVDPAARIPRRSHSARAPTPSTCRTADADGMMVSLIQSNYRGFGSGIVVPGTGISLQNRGSGFTLEEGHPNQVGSRKRPFHTIIPGLATVDGKPSMSFGVMGGHMQAQGHLQMMIRVYLHGQNPQAASDAPRWHLTEDGSVCLEDGFDTDVANELAARGHDVRLGNPEHLFGGAQLIYRLENGTYCAGSDHRKEGHAAGF